MSDVLNPDAHDPEWRAFCRDLYRLLRRDRCHGGEDISHARQLLEERGYDADASLRLYRRSGGYCDCEVLLNTAGGADERELPPAPRIHPPPRFDDDPTTLPRAAGRSTR